MENMLYPLAGVEMARQNLSCCIAHMGHTQFGCREKISTVPHRRFKNNKVQSEYSHTE